MVMKVAGPILLMKVDYNGPKKFIDFVWLWKDYHNQNQLA